MEGVLFFISVVPATPAMATLHIYVCHHVSLAQVSSSMVILAMALNNTVLPSWTGTLELKGEEDLRTSIHHSS